MEQSPFLLINGQANVRFSTIMEASPVEPRRGEANLDLEFEFLNKASDWDELDGLRQVKEPKISVISEYSFDDVLSKS